MVDFGGALVGAISSLSDPISLVFIFVGAMFGMFMGMIPGLGGVTAIALLIPVTFGMDPVLAFMLLAGVKGGEAYGGSITAILLNVPGTGPNAATLIDGYPMSRNGEAGRALGASATASAFGAFFGIFVLLLSVPIILEIVLLFGPAEIFWLGVWGLTVIALVVGDDIIKGVLSAALGLVFAVHGRNLITATSRWTYDYSFMLDGFKLVPALIGVFALAEMVKLISEGGTISKTDEDIEIGDDITKGVKDVFQNKGIFLRSAIIGTLIGTVPGIGGTAANYIAYFQAVQTSGESEKFGTGDIRGVIASEASNDAKDGGSLIPTLAFGIPGSASMAVLLGAFVVHGMTPGPLLFQNNIEIVAVIIVALFVANIMTSTVGLLLIGQLAQITQIDVRTLAPVVIIVAYFGAFAVNNVIFDLFIALLFGVIGYLMIAIDMPRVPMVLALVIGPIVETNLFRSLQLSRGSLDIFVESNISIFLIVLTLFSLALPYLRNKYSIADIMGWN
jgi:putative tricarboxylic transport membrane protein